MEDETCSLTSVKQRLARWCNQNSERKKQLAGSLVASAAAAVVLERDKGQGFGVQVEDLDQLGISREDATFKEVFGSVKYSELAACEALQDFARSFGYSVTARANNQGPNTQYPMFIDGGSHVCFQPEKCPK